jgi:hypothetical protein
MNKAPSKEVQQPIALDTQGRSGFNKYLGSFFCGTGTSVGGGGAATAFGGRAAHQGATGAVSLLIVSSANCGRSRFTIHSSDITPGNLL